MEFLYHSKILYCGILRFSQGSTHRNAKCTAPLWVEVREGSNLDTELPGYRKHILNLSKGVKS